MYQLRKSVIGTEGRNLRITRDVILTKWRNLRITRDVIPIEGRNLRRSYKMSFQLKRGTKDSERNQYMNNINVLIAEFYPGGVEFHGLGEVR